jgi:aspartyl/asparaginyl beta-hydroxylase (cupin superfamily)
MNFLDAALWEYSQIIKDSHASLLEEFQQFKKSEWVDNNQQHIGAVGDWHFIPFIGKGIKYNSYLERCPTVQQLLITVPIFDNCVFSIMGPNSEIKPHKGHSGDHLRVHLSLISDGSAYITVGSERQFWQQGELLIFRDTEEHSTANPSNNTRVVFLFDIKQQDYHSNITQKG